MSSSDKVKRHLKVRAELSPNHMTVTMKILEQTHKGYLFSQESQIKPGTTQHRGCFHRGGVTLCGVPLNRTFIERGSTSDYFILVIGYPRETIMNLKQWKEVKAAIQAYNACDSWSDED